MRTVKGKEFHKAIGMSYYGTYEINNKEYWAQGDFYYNEEKHRFEHVHVGKRGGEYLIYWKYEF